jgi:hypothetical protein
MVVQLDPIRRNAELDQPQQACQRILASAKRQDNVRVVIQRKERRLRLGLDRQGPLGAIASGDRCGRKKRLQPVGHGGTDYADAQSKGGRKAAEVM